MQNNSSSNNAHQPSSHTSSSSPMSSSTVQPPKTTSPIMALFPSSVSSAPVTTTTAPQAPSASMSAANLCEMDQFDQALRRESESLELRGIAGAVVMATAGQQPAGLGSQHQQLPSTGAQRFHPIPFAPFPSAEASSAIGGVATHAHGVAPQRPVLGWKGPIFPGAPLTPSSHAQHLPPSGRPVSIGAGSVSPQAGSNNSHAATFSGLALDEEGRAQLRADAASVIARRIGVADHRFSPAELEELLDAVLRSLNPGSGWSSATPPTVTSQQLPTPDLMLSIVAASPRPSQVTGGSALSPAPDGRQTIVSELLWADSRDPAPWSDAALQRPEKPIDSQALAAAHSAVQGGNRQPRGTPVGRTTPNTTTPSGSGTPRSGLTTQFGNASLNSTPIAARNVTTPTSVPKRSVRGVAIAPKPQTAQLGNANAISMSKGPSTVTTSSTPSQLSREALGRSDASTSKRLIRSASSAFSECSTADISSETSTNIATSSTMTQKV